MKKEHTIEDAIAEVKAVSEYQEEQRKKAELTVEGTIHISFSLYCPSCKRYLDDSDDWFYETMGSDFPSARDVEGDYEAECPYCKKEFTIKGFTQ
jgi:hypothetical protein